MVLDQPVSRQFSAHFAIFWHPEPKDTVYTNPKTPLDTQIVMQDGVKVSGEVPDHPVR